MSSVMSEIECPNCGYEEAIRDYNCRNYSEFIQCLRCGYTEDKSINYEKSKLPDYILWEIIIINGKGSYMHSTKGYIGFAIGSVLDDTVSDLKNKLDEFTVCKYTFQEDGKWHIKDLLSGEVVAFSTDLYLGKDKQGCEETRTTNTQITIEESDLDSDW